MDEAKKSAYIESTIPSYATARPSGDLITAGRQYLTQFFWERQRHEYKLYVSQAMVDEISDGDREAAQRRLDFIAGIEKLPEPDGRRELAGVYQQLLKIPNRAKADCSHLAFCVLRRIDYLLTWNCGHLGPTSQMKVREYNDMHGLWTPTLITPEGLMTPM
ncbi:MAG: type II toxin-antitoxin system VapC family toxin [Spirochaetaceae bacterium]|nr:type II toxin-antitoxin system VapC family toxin [Spirochaetaceae bacterium]